MKTSSALSLMLFTFLTISLIAQSTEQNKCLQLYLKLLPDNLTWGIYLKADNGVSPSTRTSVGTGQVTVVAPVDFKYSNLMSLAGTWVENARVNAPKEANGNSYVSFGFVIDEPRIMLSSKEETLLFTFKCPENFIGKISLIDNENDPFSTPNSYNTNPGNDIGIIDFGNPKGLTYYTYSSNYTVSSAGHEREVMLASRLED